jgi:hypothetical protein
VLRRTKTLLASGAAVVTVAGIGAGVATADTGSPTPSATPSASSSASSSAKATTKAKSHRLLSRLEHGQLTLNSSRVHTLDLQRGTVQAVSPTSLTVKSADGFTAVYTVKSTTKVRKNKAASTIGAVDVGDHVLVEATGTGAPETAFRVTDAGAGSAG